MTRIIPESIDIFYTTCMKIVLPLTLLIAIPVSSGIREAAGCNVCHSKSPKMVKMHKALGFKDCFNCHGQGLEKDPEKRKAQMTDDMRCAPCHKE